MNSATHFKKSALRSAILLALSINGSALTLSAGTAHATNEACGAPTSSDSNNFTMLTAFGYNMGADGGTNDALMSWDGTAYTSSTDYTGPGLPGSASNMTLTSSDPFFGATWAAHDIQVFAPGAYSFDTSLGTVAYPNGTNGEFGAMNVTVPAGMLGMHMLFDWSGNNNIDVFVVASPGKIFGAGIGRASATSALGASTNRCDNLGVTNPIKNCLFDGKPFGPAGKPLGSQTWMLTSIDGNGDGIMGIPMAPNGPFAGFNANFNLRGTLALTSGTVCNPTTVVHPFVFTDLTGQNINSTYTSNSITVAYDSGSGSVPVTVSGGQYSKNGGAYTSADGTAVVNDTFTVQLTTGSAEDGTTTPASLSIGGVSDTFSVTVIDKKPDTFSFSNKTGSIGALVESDPITVGGMDAGLTAPISITVGEYSKNGGAYTNLAGTVQNGDIIKVRVNVTGPSNIATLTLGSAGNGTLVSNTFTVTTGISRGNNFTMIDGSAAPGGVTGGTNNVNFFWDGNYNATGSDPVTPATAHMLLSSPTPFKGYVWTAHHIRVFGPGTYTINTDNIECPTTKQETTGCAPSATASKNYTFTVGANQIAAHILFDWNGTFDIDVVEVWNKNQVFSPSPLDVTDDGCANPANTWDLMSSDWDGDGKNGGKMIDGPFKGFSANFNIMTTGTALACSGIYTPTVNVSDPSGAGGCSISARPSNGIERGDWWLVAGFLAWLGGIQMRLKRKTRS